MLVQAGFGDANFGRHFIHRHQIVAFLREQPIDRIEDGVLAEFVLLSFKSIFFGVITVISVSPCCFRGTNRI